MNILVDFEDKDIEFLEGLLVDSPFQTSRSALIRASVKLVIAYMTEGKLTQYDNIFVLIKQKRNKLAEYSEVAIVSE
jgi:hypothetical protein